jgi:hypothetical protein
VLRFQNSKQPLEAWLTEFKISALSRSFAGALAETKGSEDKRNISLCRQQHSYFQELNTFAA